MPKRVLIVDLQQIYQGVRALYVPLIHGTLRVHVEQDPVLRRAWEFQEPICIPDRVDRLLAQVDAPDVVGFSTYIWNERNSLALARAVKEKYPACTVVFGGPQIPREPSSFLLDHPWVDVCVHGEGERSFSAILRERLQERPAWETVPGISFRENGRQRFGPPGERLERLHLPSPFALGYFDAFAERGRAWGFNLVASLETSRGCPYRCAFCNWGMATGTRPRFYPDERVRADLEWVARQRISMVFLIDANFGILPRDVALMEDMAASKRSTGFPKWVMVSGFAKNNKDRTFEITRILQDNGFDEGVTVNFSLQATSQAALDAIDRQNIPLDSYRELSDKYAENGYTLTPDLIFPLPGETLESFQEGYADLASWGHVNRIRAYPLVILPNTPMARPEYREQWGLRTRVERLRIPLLDSVCAEMEDEFVEAVVATRRISEADAAEARRFVAVVNALEVYRLTRLLRSGLGMAAVDFYRGWMRWQLAHGGMLAGILEEMIANFMAGAEHCEELGWSGGCAAPDGSRMMPVKALTWHALADAERFRSELRSFAAEGRSWGPREDDLLAFQAGMWIGPGYDPTEEREGTYRRDWIGGGEGPVRIRWTPRGSAVRFGYAPGVADWKLHFLCPFQHDTFCCHAEGERVVVEHR